MSVPFETGQKILAEQPFSGLLGAELTAFEDEKAEVSLAVRDDLKQHQGYVHGGVICYLADTALAYAGGSVLGDAVTSEFKINFVRPATGQRLVAQASVLSSGKQQAVCECKVVSVDHKGKTLIAIAQGTVSTYSTGNQAEPFSTPVTS